MHVYSACVSRRKVPPDPALHCALGRPEAFPRRRPPPAADQEEKARQVAELEAEEARLLAELEEALRQVGGRPLCAKE